jgi:hypothetical protein
METSLKKSCLGSLYLANSDLIQNSWKFMVAEASKLIFELAENTWAVYSTWTINTNTTPYQVQRRIRHKWVVQGTRPDQARGGPLDLHIASCHDLHCIGPLPDRHADLKEMFQHPSISGDTFSSTFGSTYADSQPTPDLLRHPGDQQSGHQIKHVYSDSYQHLMKKLPKEINSPIFCIPNKQGPPQNTGSSLPKTIQDSRGPPPIHQANTGWMAEIGGC